MQSGSNFYKKRTIYVIENINNNKMYIGMTINLERRIIDHFTKLNTGKHVNRLLQEDYIKYGRKSFVYRPLTEVRGLRDARRKEKELIKKYNTENTGYNMVSNKK